MSTPERTFGFGQPATAEQIAGWDIDIAPDGAGLPPGSGTVAEGKELFDRLGAKCHGAKGEGGDAPAARRWHRLAQYRSSRSRPSAATGRMPRRCSTTSDAPCRPTSRNR